MSGQSTIQGGPEKSNFSKSTAAKLIHAMERILTAGVLIPHSVLGYATDQLSGGEISVAQGQKPWNWLGKWPQKLSTIRHLTTFEASQVLFDFPELRLLHFE
eukprot:g70606.t1